MHATRSSKLHTWSWRSSKKCPTQVQQFKVIISRLLGLHCIIIVHEQFITQSSHIIRDEEIIAGSCEDFSVNKWSLFREMLEQCNIRPWTGSECNWENIRKHDFKKHGACKQSTQDQYREPARSTYMHPCSAVLFWQKWQIIATSKRVQICLIFGM